MSDLPASLRRGGRIATGPNAAIRATSPASPYARDRVEAPSNRPAARTPTLRSRTQDVVRSAPGALTTARERFNYDLSPAVSRGARDAINSLPDTDWARVGQELTGLPSLARGAGGLTGLARRGMAGGFERADLWRSAGPVAETALGLAGPMSLPRSAGRASFEMAPRHLRGGFRNGHYSAEQFYRHEPLALFELENANIPFTSGSVPTSRLVGTQRTVARDFNSSQRPRDPIDVYQRGEDFYIADGHNRAAAAVARGDSEIPARIRQMPAEDAFGEPAQRIPNMAREIGPNGMPIAQSQPYRNSLRGGSADLREAAGMGAAPPVGRISGMPAPEGRRIVYQGGPRPLQGDTLDDAALGTGQGAATFGRGHYVAENPIVGESYARQLGEDGRGFTHELDIPEGPYIDLFKPFSQQDPRAQEAIRRLAPQVNWDAVTSEMSDALTILGRNERRVAEQLSGEGVRGFRYLDQRSRPGSGLSHLADPTSNYVVFRGADAQRRFPDFGARTPPPTTPTGTAPFGDPRAYPQSTWEEFGSLQGGTPEARLRAQEQGPLAITNDPGGPSAPGAVPPLAPPSTSDSVAMRMARAERMGFDVNTPLYHGTASNIDAFNNAQRGSVTGARSARGAHWLVDRPDVASGYAENASAQQVQRLIDASYAAERRGQWDEANRLMAEAETLEQQGTSGANVMPLTARGRFMDFDAEGQNAQQVGEDGLNSLLERARNDGFDGVRVRNFDDNADWGSGRLATHYGIFNPSHIRSRFAAFDPAKRDSSDLLAGLTAAVPIPLASALSQPHQGRPQRRPSLFSGQR